MWLQVHRVLGQRPRRPGPGGRTHIAIVVENIPFGADSRLRKQVTDLLHAGYQVSVITRGDRANDAWRDVDHLRLLEYPSPREPRRAIGYGQEYALSFLWAAVLGVRLRLAGRIDVLQLCQPPDIYFPLAWLLRWTGTYVVVDQRDLMPEILASRYEHPPRTVTRLLLWLERRTQHVAHRTVTVNDYLKDRLVRSGAQPESVAVVRNGPVFARIAEAVPRPPLRGRHRYLVCWLGKMGRQDCADVVVRVAARVVHGQGRMDCGFVLIGDGECLAELRALTNTEGLTHFVTFTGWLPEAQVFDYLASCDVGLDSSSQGEVSPVKAMEYMASGLPLVCFDLPETRRITEGAAVLVPPGDEPALAAALLALLDDPQRRRRLGEAGRRRVREWLSWERQSAEYLASIRSLAPSKPPRAG